MPFFDPKECGFYSDGRNDVPAGAIEISEELRAELIGAGLPIALNSQGIPASVHPNKPTLPELAEAIHARQTTAINRSCEAAITAGFTSDALGSSHHYTSQLDDQLNLTGAVLRGLDMPYACRDEQGVKEFRLHAAEQLRQVGDDFTLYKLQLLQHANALKQQLDAALDTGDLDALEAITWEAPQL